MEDRMLKTEKHAYLIIAHDNFEVLKKLLILLDDERNDLFIHIDKKSGKIDYNEFKNAIKHSKITFIKRNNVYWGGYSQIKCELNLLKASIGGNYQYYHLLSGIDLPLKTPDEIHKFFEKNKGKEFIHFESTTINKSYFDRIKYYCLFFKRKEFYSPGKFLLKIQRKLKINRIENCEMTFQKGTNWFSITNDLAHYVLKQEKEIKKLYKHTYCCDEIFLHTIVFNSEFKNNLFSKKIYAECEISLNRLIDWDRGRPYVFVNEDFEELINSNCIFARKFDTQTDSKIVEKIYDYILQKKDRR